MKVKAAKKISIIGSGVSGITCGYLLTLLGFDVTIYSKPVGSATKNLDPTNVSLFPSASIIPHSVSHPELHSLFKNSQDIFDILFGQNFHGLFLHKHFELFAESNASLPYSSQLKNVESILESELQYPRHSKIEIKSGWMFDCFFADWSLYFPYLIDKFRSNGGRIIDQFISKTDLLHLDSDIVINCAEIGGPLFTDEAFEPVIYRGHLLFIPNAPKLLSNNGDVTSFNFTPGQQYYESENGALQDVYCYPREDGWILGGSRQKGTIDLQGQWVGEETVSPFVEIDNQKIPKQILDLNRDIISTSFGVELNEYGPISQKTGYRFMGNGSEELRIESEEKDGKLIIHNYGHGGAGVTLSWGCALEVANQVLRSGENNELSIEEMEGLRF